MVAREMRSPKDTKCQEEVARRLEKEWDCFMHLSFGKWSAVNYEASDDHAREEVFAHVEIRCRNVSSFDYDRITMFGYDKYESMKKHQKKYKVPVWFVVKFNNNDIYWIPLDDILPASEIAPGGREPRFGATHDQGEMVYLPLDAMNRLAPPKRKAV